MSAPLAEEEKSCTTVKRNDRRGGRIAAGLRPVDEQTRIDIAATLVEFRASDATEYAFPPGLSNHDRAVVHNECKKYGLRSKSFGKGEKRAVTVFKLSGHAKRYTDVFELPLGTKSREMLDNYFSEYPPTSFEVQELDDVCHLKGLATKIPGIEDQEQEVEDAPISKRDPTRSKIFNHAALFNVEEIDSRVKAWQRMLSRPEMKTLKASRDGLPIVGHREEILRAIKDHQVVLIAGETGCGKTTQVPQYILEDMWEQRKGCRVICTQPRRISAVSVAERVAVERGEDRAGGTVGYTIRLDSVGGPHSSLLFCTNGVLLRMLTGNAKSSRELESSDEVLRRTTHIVIDEIHERDRFADFLLILIKELLPSYPHLRVVLMSATLHIDLFARYFGGCPVIQVPGYTHPVEDYFLEDVLKVTGYQETVIQDTTNSRKGTSVSRYVGISKQDIVAGRSSSAGDAVELETETGKRSDGESSESSKDNPTSAMRRRVEAAIERAFRVGGDEDFEALLEETGAAATDDAAAGAPGINVRHRATGATPLIAACYRGRIDIVSVLLSNGADPSLKAKNDMKARDFAVQGGFTEIVEMLDDFEQQTAAAEELASTALALSHYQAMTDADEVDLDLIELLLCYICGEGQFQRRNEVSTRHDADKEILGAILIFLPGWDEIIRLKDKLESSQCFRSRSKYVVLPLHSMVAPSEQRRVFVRPPLGIRKIVLATNIAETAITIDDVVCVIDTGKIKEKSYDPYTGVSTLQGAWISKASEKQRRGRAGRCQPGVAFHLYSRQRSESLTEFQLPELKRSALDEIALQVKLLKTDMKETDDDSTMVRNTEGQPSTGNKQHRRSGLGIAAFLEKAIDPPVPQAVNRAIELLRDIGALDENEKITVLGRHLAALPLPPALGKLLLYGVLFKCLDPMLTIACCMSYRDPWVLPTASDARKQASGVRARLSIEAGGSSDHLTTVLAFNRWKATKSNNSDKQFCSRYFLSPATMAMVDGMRGQLLNELRTRRFIRSLEDSSINAHRADLVRAVLGCGFYPQIGRLLTVSKNDFKAKASILTRKGEKVRIHPSSVNAQLRITDDVTKVGDHEDGAEAQCAALLIFDEITRGDAFMYLKSCTAIHPHPAILVAMHTSCEMDESTPGGGETKPESKPSSEAKGTDGVLRDSEPSDPATGGKAGFEDTGKTHMSIAMEGMQLQEHSGGSDRQSTKSHCVQAAADSFRFEYAILLIDNWLRFRVPRDCIPHLVCLKSRIAQSFAELVRKPGKTLQEPLSRAIEVAIVLFMNESESADGHETQLSLSFAPRIGKLPKMEGFHGFASQGEHRSRHAGSHVFRYSHQRESHIDSRRNDASFGGKQLNGRRRSRNTSIACRNDAGCAQGRDGSLPSALEGQEMDACNTHGIKRRHSDRPGSNAVGQSSRRRGNRGMGRRQVGNGRGKGRAPASAGIT